MYPSEMMRKGLFLSKCHRERQSMVLPRWPSKACAVLYRAAVWALCQGRVHWEDACWCSWAPGSQQGVNSVKATHSTAWNADKKSSFPRWVWTFEESICVVMWHILIAFMSKALYVCNVQLIKALKPWRGNLWYFISKDKSTTQSG